MLAPHLAQKRLVNKVAPMLHAGEYFDAAREVAAYFNKISKSEMPVGTKAEADTVMTLFLQWLLNHDGYEEAAQLLWGPTLFDPRPESTRRVWKAFEDHNFILLMGAGSMSKSYSMAVRLFLEWVRDPEHTTIKVLGPSENHLEDNLFTHLVSMHRQSTIPLPGQINQLFIGLDPRERKSSISGVVVPLGKKAAGRLQGTKRANRKKPHPVFGPTYRMFIFLDEIANIPTGIWRDIDNLMTGASGDSLKIVGAFNPTDQQDEVGKRTEPPVGWQMFDPDTEFEWISTRGWKVVRLDAKFSENVVQKKVVYPGLQTEEGFKLLIANSGGTDSPGYWSMGRGCFPPTGIPMSIIPSGLLADIKAEILWYDHPTPVGSVDLAFNGADKAIFIKGSFGPATGMKLPPSLAFPEGRTIMFKGKDGSAALKDILLAETLLVMPKGDTVQQYEEIVRIARIYNIRPDCLCIDRTGHGQGTYDMLRHNFGEVIGVNYSESSSETKVMQEDHDIAYELYVRAHSELWFALRKFIEFGYFKISLGFDTTDLFPQLTGRRFRSFGKKAKVEEKDDYKSRNNGKSPDEADTTSLLVQAVRKAFSFIPGMVMSNSRAGDEDDDEGPRIDITNRTEDLDMEMGP